MDFLETLKRARFAEQSIQIELEQIERLHRIMKNTGHSRAYAQSLVENLSKLEEELNESIDRTVDEKREALKILSSLRGEERAVLYQYYILCKEWRVIADEMFISERQVYIIRKKALLNLEKHYSREKKAC